MHSKKSFVAINLLGLIFGLMVVLTTPSTTPADLIVVKEVLQAPKGGRLVANIGPVNSQVRVSLINARVDLTADPKPKKPYQPLRIKAKAVFELRNRSEHSLMLTVGFPVSNTRFSSSTYEEFKVVSMGEERTVFNRISSYPRSRTHRHVSGPPGKADELLPDLKSGDKGVPVRPKIFPVEKMGALKFHNLMVWPETFKPDETRVIEIKYILKVPTQNNRLIRNKVRGSYKGAWPEEANNLPLDFLGMLPQNKDFYFFDYYLVSGASWKGPIENEQVNLHLDKSWSDSKFYSNVPERLNKKMTSTKKGIAVSIYTYKLTNEEPKENLYFALSVD